MLKQRTLKHHLPFISLSRIKVYVPEIHQRATSLCDTPCIYDIHKSIKFRAFSWFAVSSLVSITRRAFLRDAHPLRWMSGQCIPSCLDGDCWLAPAVSSWSDLSGHVFWRRRLQSINEAARSKYESAAELNLQEIYDAEEFRKLVSLTAI